MFVKLSTVSLLLFVSGCEASILRWRRREPKGSKSSHPVKIVDPVHHSGVAHFRRRKRMRHYAIHHGKSRQKGSSISYNKNVKKVGGKSVSKLSKSKKRGMSKDSMSNKTRGKGGRRRHRMMMKRKRVPAYRTPTNTPYASPGNDGLERSPTLFPVSPSSPPTATPVMAPRTPSPNVLPECDNPVLIASGNNGDYYSMFQFCGGSIISDTFPNSVIEVVYDPTTDRSWAQQGIDTFEMFEFDPTTGIEITNTRFSTNGVNQFHALEYVNGVLYGGGWMRGTGEPEPQSTLYIIDVDNQNWTVVGPSNVGRLTGLAWTGTTMYGVSGAVGPTSQLYEMDLATGEGTVLCDSLTAVFGSLVYFQNKLYGGTSDGNVAEILPGTCEVLDIDTPFAWSAGFRPVTGLSVYCE